MSCRHEITSPVDEDGCCISCGEDLNSLAMAYEKGVKDAEKIWSDMVTSYQKEFFNYRRALYEVMKHHTPDDDCECCSCKYARELMGYQK